jgi:AcrR family transcriptional regulator
VASSGRRTVHLDVTAVSPDAPIGTGLRERKKSERRARITAAASRIFREKGYEDATLREIAASADVGTGTIFSYARDKRELLMLVINDELSAVADEAFRTVPDAPLLDQLLHVFTPRLTFWARDPNIARHALHESSGDPHNAETSRFGSGRSVFLNQLISIVQPHQAAGDIDPALDPALVARLLADVYIGENRRWLATREPIVPDGVEQLARVLSLAIRGIS